MIVRRQDLVLDDVALNTGGQGQVFGADAATAKLVGSGVPVVVKRYINDRSVLPGGLAELDKRSDWLRGLDDASRAELLAHAAWPLAAIVDGSRLWGIVMQDLRDRFRADMLLPSGKSRPVLTSLEHVLQDDAYLARRFGTSFTTVARTHVGAAIALSMAVLHRHGVVASDVSHKNILLGLDPPYPATFIDCDSMVFRGAEVLKEVETPGWEMPAALGERPYTRTADAYKLALVILRIYRRSVSATWNAATLSGTGTAVAPSLAILAALESSLTGGARATPGEWVQLLRASFGVDGVDAAAPVVRATPTPSTPRPRPVPRPLPQGPKTATTPARPWTPTVQTLGPTTVPAPPRRRASPVGTGTGTKTGTGRPPKPRRRAFAAAAAAAAAAAIAWATLGTDDKGGPVTPAQQPTTAAASVTTSTTPHSTKTATKAKPHHKAAKKRASRSHNRSSPSHATATVQPKAAGTTPRSTTTPKAKPAPSTKTAARQTTSKPTPTGGGLSGSQSTGGAGGGLSGSATGDGGGGLSGSAGP